MVKRTNSLWSLIQTLWIWFWGIGITIVVLFFCMICALLRQPRWIHKIAFLWGKSITFFCRTDIQVEGKEKIYRDGPVIFVLNHQSLFDILIIYNFLDVQFRWMAKASLFKIPVFGHAMKAADYIPVERGDRKLALKSLFDAAEHVRQGTSVVIFPEGTRGHPDGSMLPFKKGGFILAKKAQVTIQPITLWGANQIVPVDRTRTIQRIYPGVARAVIHDPILLEDYKDLSADQLSDKVEAVIKGPMDRLKAFAQALDS